MAKKEVIKEAKIEDINKKDKMVGIIIVVLMILTLGVLGTYFQLNKRDFKLEKTDAIKFKEEYEEYNAKETDNKKKYQTLNISRNNVIEYADYKKVFEALDNETAVIYFGFPTCPWCRTLIPSLLDAAENVGIEKIYYLNNKDSRDIKKLEKKKIITEKEGTEDYYKLVSKLDKFLGEYECLKDKNIKRLYFPTVVFVKEGKVTDIHIGTLDSHEDGFKELTDKQKKELNDTLVDKMSSLLTCTGAC